MKYALRKTSAMDKHLITNLGKLALCGFVFFLGIEIGDAVVSLLGLPVSPLAPGAERNLLRLYTALFAPLLALVLALVAQGLGGSVVIRTLVLTFLIWIVYSVNDQLEGLIVSTYTTGFGHAIMRSLVPSIFCGTMIANVFRSTSEDEKLGAILETFFARLPIGAWLGRLSLASIVFMPVYFLFGLLVLPFVADYYQQSQYGLQAPALNLFFPILFVRSVLFFLACLPIFIVWRSSARGLFIRLGFVLFVLVAFPSIFTAYWLPLQLRLPHSLEILADEFAYAGLLVMLIGRPRDSRIHFGTKREKARGI